MKHPSKITNIVMDFDGTCTQIPLIYEAFLAQYLVGLNTTVLAQAPIMKAEWWEAQQEVRKHSPTAPWTIKTAPASPAAADPYILAYECAQHVLRKKQIKADIPLSVFQNAASNNMAPWRNEARSVFDTLLKHGIHISFISNTDSATIYERLKALFAVETIEQLPKGISVMSGASKYAIAELLWDSSIPHQAQEAFGKVPAVHADMGIYRPVYLRRGYYFEAISAALGHNMDRLLSTVFCGDIWEMDLAMPHALGANIHLIERAAPFDTYPYERNAVLAAKGRGKIGKDLTSLLEWI